MTEMKSVKWRNFVYCMTCIEQLVLLWSFLSSLRVWAMLKTLTIIYGQRSILNTKNKFWNVTYGFSNLFFFFFLFFLAKWFTISLCLCFLSSGLKTNSILVIDWLHLSLLLLLGWISITVVLADPRVVVFSTTWTTIKVDN